MSAEFDPSEFETTEPAPDYRELLDAIRQAGATGVRQEVASLTAALRQEEAAREAWVQTTATGLSRLSQATSGFDQAAGRLLRTRAVELLLCAAAIIGTIALSFAVIQFLREPKIVERLYGCTKWDQKTATCKGKWIPLHKD